MATNALAMRNEVFLMLNDFELFADVDDQERIILAVAAAS